MQTWGKRRVKFKDFFKVSRRASRHVRTSLPHSLYPDERAGLLPVRAGTRSPSRRNRGPERPSDTFLAHTSASLCIQENADPDVLLDLTEALGRFAPENAAYRHHSEGPDDMPAHIKTLLTATSLSLPVRNTKLALGTWQEVYLIEHRKAAHERRLEIDFAGYTKN
jgi:secondary thiamine-phosphate synthase enzyme